MSRRNNPGYQIARAKPSPGALGKPLSFVSVVFSITPEHYAALDAAAKALRWNRSMVLREVLDQWLKNREEKRGMESTKIERCRATIHRTGQADLTCQLQPNHPKGPNGSEGHVFQLDAADTAQFERGRLVGIEQGRDQGREDALEALDRCIHTAGEPTRQTLVSARAFIVERLGKP